MSNSFTEHFATCQTVNECLKKFDELNHSGTIQALKERLLVVTDSTEKKTAWATNERTKNPNKTSL